MIDRDLLRNLIEKENMSRNLQWKAGEQFKKCGNKPSKEQCMLLQRAADLESEMANMTIGAEKEQHIREMNRLDYECAQIQAQLDRGRGGKPKENDKPDDKASEKPSSDGVKPNTNDNSEKKTQEEIEIDRAARTWYKDAPKHDFEDVAGMEDMKNKLRSCVADARANNLRAFLQIPKLNSYFFVGPPGCGKTFICEAFAHELMNKDYKFISILGSDIISKYAGTAEKSVTRLFEEAMKSAPCIVFVDEIDSLCKNRSLPNLPEYAANITTSFLTGYNKIHSEDSDVIFMAATNYPNRVDAAMLDRAEIIRLPLPDKDARCAAFEREFSYKEETGEGEDKSVEYKPIIQLKKGLTFEMMAEKTWRFNYRDIERLASGIKKTLFRELIDFFGEEQLAIDALKSGDFKLTVKKFDEILSKFKPSPKQEILRDLLHWEKKVQSMADIAETNLEQMYDCEKLADSSAETEIEIEVETEEIEAKPVSNEPVYPLSDSFAPDPMLGITEIKFGIGLRKPENPVAFVDSEEVELHEDEEGYFFSYKPDDDEDEIKVIVRDNAGFIGSFTAVIKRAISDNEDFDI